MKGSPMYVDAELRIQRVEEGQPLTMAIRGGPLQDATILENEVGEPVVFQIEEGKGVYLGKVYVTP